MKKIVSGFCLVLMGLSLSATSSANLINWNIGGLGATSSTQIAPGNWNETYYLKPAGYNTVSWLVTGMATDAGNYSFDWNYSGFHAYYSVTAFLKTISNTSLYSAGPANCCSSPSGGFNASGSYTFTNVAANTIIGFQVGGRNYDSNNVLSGTLNLKQTSNTSSVPEPSTLALLALGLFGLGFRRYAKS
jgi:hypothetical protein